MASVKGESGKLFHFLGRTRRPNAQEEVQGVGKSRSERMKTRDGLLHLGGSWKGDREEEKQREVRSR